VKATSVSISDAAVSDIVEQADRYEAQSGRPVAIREKAVTSALLRIVKIPAAGTLCSFDSLELRHVRRTLIAGFPKHLIFYSFSGGQVSVLRVVHGARDLERLL
jgi:plasmid stabilization system protein ParE